MPTNTVLINQPIHIDALARLKEEASALTPFQASADEIRAMLPQIQGVILGTGNFGPAEMDLAEKLAVIGRNGVGLDNVNVGAATARGIPVTYTPYGPTESTAEHAFLLILATARRLAELDRSVRIGDFTIRDRAEAMGHEIDGLTLGVVGFGRIGRRLAEMCRAALHMKVHVYDPYLEATAATDWGAIRETGLIEMARNVDILSVHTPLTPETVRLIDRNVIQALRPGAILVNTSRGPVVDEEALVEALEGGHLGGAGLDVYDPQPPAPDNPLLHFNQVVLTPHVASFTHEGRRRMGMTVVEDVLRVLRDEQPEYLANPEVWPRRRVPVAPDRDI